MTIPKLRKLNIHSPSPWNKLILFKSSQSISHKRKMTPTIIRYFPFLCWFGPHVTDTTSAHSLLMKTSHFPNLIIEETGKCMSFPLCSRKETGWHSSSQILQHYTLKIASTVSWCQYSKRYFQFFQYRRNSF